MPVILAELSVALQKVHFVLGGVEGLDVVRVLRRPLLFQLIKVLLLAAERHFLVVVVELLVNRIPRFHICCLSGLDLAFYHCAQLFVFLLIIVPAFLSTLKLLSGLFGFEVPLDHDGGLLALFV